MNRKYLDRPCWRCGHVVKGEEVARIHVPRYTAIECPKCGARISIRGPPVKKKSSLVAFEPTEAPSPVAPQTEEERFHNNLLNVLKIIEEYFREIAGAIDDIRHEITGRRG